MITFTLSTNELTDTSPEIVGRYYGMLSIKIKYKFKLKLVKKKVHVDCHFVFKIFQRRVNLRLATLPRLLVRIYDSEYLQLESCVFFTN